MTKPIPILPPHLVADPSWVSWSTSARVLGHPLVWLAATAIFLLLGYFWLQSFTTPIQHELGQKKPNSSQIGNRDIISWNPATKAAPKTIDVMAITQGSDDIRAEEYRLLIDKENRILPLLNTARALTKNGQYIGTGNDNAWQNYQAILDIEPQHKLAITGQERVLLILQDKANFAVEKKQYEQAEHWLGQIDQAKEGGDFQINLRQRISDQINAELIAKQAEQQEIEREQVLNAALEDALIALNDSPPNFRAAYDLYSHALGLEKDNQSALDGIEKIHQQRIQLTKINISNNDFALANAQINRLIETQAKAQQVTQLQNMLATAQKPVLPKQNLNTTLQQSIPEKTTQTRTALSDDKQFNENNDQSTIEPKNPTAVPNSDIPKPNLLVASTDTNAQNDQSSNLNQGIIAYYAGNYDLAFKQLHPLAVSGVSRAQFRLGMMYNQGRTVIQNKNLARQWIVRALPDILHQSEQGEAWAQADLATVYEFGLGLDKNLSKAAIWYTKAAEQGYAGAQTNLGVLYVTGEGVNYDRQKALYWLKRAARQGDKIAQDNLLMLNAR